MAIPISDIINVQIAVSPTAVSVDGFGPLLFMTKEFKPVGGEHAIRSYSSLKEVESDFPTGEIHKAALAWYGQKPTPKTFLVGAILNEIPTQATYSTLTATKTTLVATLKALESSVITIQLLREAKTAEFGSFKDMEDFDEILEAINQGFSRANIPVEMSQTGGTFKLTANEAGSNEAIFSATGSLAEAVKLDNANNPTSKVGEDAKDIGTDLRRISESTLNFFYVGVDRSFRKTENQELVAKWCNANDKVFGWADNDPNILKLGTENSFKKAKSLALSNTICVYDASENGDEYPEVAILARAATVNFNVANSALVLAFKKGPGITTADLSSGQLTALRSYNGNAFIAVGDNQIFLDGRMADKTWFDTIQGVEWLKSKIRANVFNLFYTSTTKIPWTDGGVAKVEQQVTLALTLARTNGLVAPGYDEEGVFYPEGFKVFSTPLELLQSEKGDRIWSGTSFKAIGAGAMQGAIISGSFVQ